MYLMPFDIAADTDLCSHSAEMGRLENPAAAFGRDHAKLRFPASHSASPHAKWWGATNHRVIRGTGVLVHEPGSD